MQMQTKYSDFICQNKKKENSVFLIPLYNEVLLFVALCNKNLKKIHSGFWLYNEKMCKRY